MKKTTPTSSRAVNATWLAIYALLSFCVMAVFLVKSDCGYNVLGDYLCKLCRYRVLVPAIMKTALYSVPTTTAQSATVWLDSLLDSKTGAAFMESCRIDVKEIPILKQHIFEIAVGLPVLYLTLLAFLAMLYYVTKALLPESHYYARTVVIVALVTIPIGFLQDWSALPYDFAEMFFSSACFYLLFRQRWYAYIACYTLATLNKETTIFSFCFYCLWFWGQLPRQQFFKFALLQIAIATAIRMVLIATVSDMKPIYPYGVVGNFVFPINFAHAEQQLIYVREHLYSYIATFTFVALMLGYRWSEKPAFLRAGLWMVGLNLLAFFLTCHPGEYRDLFWSIPVMSMMVAHTIVSACGTFFKRRLK